MTGERQRDERGTAGNMQVQPCKRDLGFLTLVSRPTSHVVQYRAMLKA